MRQILKIIVVVAGLLTVCVIGYAIHKHRERAKWAKIHKEQLEKLEQLKRLKWYKGKIGRYPNTDTKKRLEITGRG